MATTNDITGDQIRSRAATDAYRDNWDKIFKKKEDAKSDKNEADKNSDND